MKALEINVTLNHQPVVVHATTCCLAEGSVPQAPAVQLRVFEPASGGISNFVYRVDDVPPDQRHDVPFRGLANAALAAILGEGSRLHGGSMSSALVIQGELPWPLPTQYQYDWQEVELEG